MEALTLLVTGGGGFMGESGLGIEDFLVYLVDCSCSDVGSLVMPETCGTGIGMTVEGDVDV